MALVEEKSAGREGARTSAMGFWRTVAAGALGGGFVGLLTGGVLGRVLMRLLAVTSPESVRGRLTDDIQPVGQISLGGTLQLFVTTVALGAVAGLVYLWVRRVLPVEERSRRWLFALFVGSIGGAFLLHDHPSFDYSVLRPEWLAVTSFVVIPTLYGLFAPPVIDRLASPGGWAMSARAWVVLVVCAAALNLTLVLVTVPVLAAFAISRSTTATRAWHSTTVTVAGRALFVLMVAWGLYGIVTDVVSIATNTPSGAPLTP
ncbi:hypothetical protein [Georgenia muralis]